MGRTNIMPYTALSILAAAALAAVSPAASAQDFTIRMKTDAGQSSTYYVRQNAVQEIDDVRHDEVRSGDQKNQGRGAEAVDNHESAGRNGRATVHRDRGLSRPERDTPVDIRYPRFLQSGELVAESQEILQWN